MSLQRLTLLPSPTDNDIGLYQITAGVTILICRTPVPAERANDVRRVLFNHVHVLSFLLYVDSV